MKKISALETAASEAGYTLSDDDKAYVDEAISSTKKAAESYGYAYDGYLKAMYGKYMTPSAFKTCVEREALVNGYQSAYADSLGITDEDIQAYYEENASTLDTYDYRYIYLSGKAASTTDEDGRIVERYANARSQLVLERRIIGAEDHADTYYVYNDRDSLAWVLPPECTARLQQTALAPDDPLASRYCYVYTYDGRGNVTEKRLPGCGPQRYIYDQGDRMIAMQDGNMRQTDSWEFTHTMRITAKQAATPRQGGRSNRCKRSWAHRVSPPYPARRRLSK